MAEALEPAAEDHTGPARRFETPLDLRRAARSGQFGGQTSGHCPGALQVNLAILPADLADAFLRYCVRNPKPCPVIGVGEPGATGIPGLGDDLDVSRDTPSYRIWRDGEPIATVPDASPYWRDDLVAFALGCSFSFEDALVRAGIPVRHIAAGRNVPMYETTIETAPAPPFGGPLVVSLRAFRPADAIRAITLSERYPQAHGSPVHMGDPSAIGIADLSPPDFGDPPVLRDGDIPVFWACGVTPQLAIRTARPPFAITPDPGHMLVTDVNAER